MSIELQIRKAILAAGATSAESRVEVYSQAKRAVCKLPTEMQMKLTQELSNAIYAIEYECYVGTTQARTPDQIGDGSENHASAEATETKIWADPNRRPIILLLKDWLGNPGKLAVVWLITVGLGIGLAVGYYRSSKQGAEVLKTQDALVRNAKSSVIEPVFELVYPRDIDNLVVSRKGVKIDKPAISKSGEFLTITDEINILTSKIFQIDRNKTYIGQISFRIVGAQESESSLPKIYAGLYNLDADGNPMKDGKVFSHFVHAGTVDPLRISSDQERDVTITGIISVEGQGQHDKFVDGAVSFKLFTGVAMGKKDWNVDLRSLKLSELR